MSRGKQLRELMGLGMVVAPFCCNAFHAQIARSVGFEAVYMTGSGTAAERGYPDVGLVTQTEMVENARYIAGAVDVPLICDADTGYGNPINVWPTVREYENAGVAAIHIEDQVSPKRCGFLKGKAVIPVEEHVQKIRAALDARQDKGLVIIARTDALSVNGWDDTVRRCRAYRAAGADLVFVDGIRTREDVETYARLMDGLPRVYCGGLLPTREIAAKGYRLMITGGTTMIIYKALKTAFGELKQKGVLPVGIAGIPEGPLAEELNRVRGLSAINEMETRYKSTGGSYGHAGGTCQKCGAHDDSGRSD